MDFMISLISPFIDSVKIDYDNYTWIYVWFILSVFSGFLIHLIKRYKQSKKKTANIYSKLNDSSRNSINQKRQNELKEYFDSHKATKEVWHEFDESLVKVGQENVYNTIDASFFFNSESLGSKFIDSRLIASVPGLLTALGVLGTFYGLSKGLSGIELAGDDIAVMKNGISTLLAGAGTAFMTSLWGVGLSFIYNVVEKFLDRSLQNKIKQLQDKVDELFARKTAESQLQEIAESSHESKNTLKGLAEEIGSQMQTVMTTAGTIMGDKIADKLGEKMDDLLAKLNGGNEMALGSLITDFTQGLKDSGANSGAQLASASNENRETFTAFSESMTSFISNFDDRMATQEARDITRNESLKKVVEDIAEQSQVASSKLRDAVDELISQLGSEVTKAVSEITKEEKKRSDEKLSESVQVNELIVGQTEKVQQLMSQSERLSESVDEIGRANIRVAEELTKASTEIHHTSNEFKTASTSISSGISELGSQIKSTGRTVEDIGNANNQAIEKLDSVQLKFEQQYIALKEVVLAVDKLADGAESTFENLTEKQKLFNDEFKTTIEDVQTKVKTFLSDYSKQVQDQTSSRMNDWNSHTKDYTQHMKGVVDTMSGIVDEIDAKLSKVQS